MFYLSFGIEARFNIASSIVCGSTFTFLIGVFPLIFGLFSVNFRLIIFEIGSLSSSSSEHEDKSTGGGGVNFGVHDLSMRSGSGGV